MKFIGRYLHFLVLLLVGTLTVRDVVPIWQIKHKLELPEIKDGEDGKREDVVRWMITLQAASQSTEIQEIQVYRLRIHDKGCKCSQEYASWWIDSTNYEESTSHQDGFYRLFVWQDICCYPSTKTTMTSCLILLCYLIQALNFRRVIPVQLSNSHTIPAPNKPQWLRRKLAKQNLWQEKLLSKFSPICTSILQIQDVRIEWISLLFLSFIRWSHEEACNLSSWIWRLHY